MRLSKAARWWIRFCLGRLGIFARPKHPRQAASICISLHPLLSSRWRLKRRRLKHSSRSIERSISTAEWQRMTERATIISAWETSSCRVYLVVAANQHPRACIGYIAGVIRAGVTRGLIKTWTYHLILDAWYIQFVRWLLVSVVLLSLSYHRMCIVTRSPSVT